MLVTGGGSGLGLGVARHCMAEGVEVVIVDVPAEKVRQLKEEFGDKVLAMQGDVTKLDDLRACRDAIGARYGRLNALIGAQGIFDGNLPLMQIPVERIDALFDEIFHVNVKGYMLSARVFFDLLQASKGAQQDHDGTDGGRGSGDAESGGVEELKFGVVGARPYLLADR